MHLADILRLRAVPASAIFLAITRRCPLSCRHCSTASTMSSQEVPERMFRRFVDTFRPDCHPQLVLMTGGEALLRPALVEWVARRAREAGTSSYLLSGMFFVRGRSVPAPIRRAIDSVDHFAASLDAFHEEEVPRHRVLRFLGELADQGKAVSLQVTGLSDDDPYLADVTGEITAVLGDRVPVLVDHVGAVGRAAGWLDPEAAGNPHQPAFERPSPCSMAGWPVVSFDGGVSTCCNQAALDRGIPDHLRLGHASTDGWPEVRERCLTRPMLRTIRLIGPQALATRAGLPVQAGYCETCVALAGQPAAARVADELAARPTTGIVEAEVQRLLAAAGPTGVAREYGSVRYAALTELGAER